MEPKFNIDRPKIGDEEIRTHQNFEELVKQFKKQSLKQAKGDESWRKNKKVRYSTVIAGVTVICTITLLALFKNEKTKQQHETLTTTQTTNTVKKAGTASLISPPSQKLKISYSAYKVSGATGGEIKHPSSSKIKIPKNAFVDKSGKDIVGDVTIEYREFHDAADIILSGIPMAYDSAGHKFNFETAGMFEIKGSQNGEPVFLKPDKNVEVELASTVKDNRFNQYYLDTVARNWKYLKRDTPTPVNHPTDVAFDNSTNSAAAAKEKTSPKLQSLKEEVDVVLPKRIDSVKVVYVKKAARLPKYSEPAKPRSAIVGRPTFRLDGSYNEFPELAAFNDVVFEVGPENTNYVKQMHNVTWSDVKINEGPIKGENYWLTLTYRNQVEKLVVYPTLSGKELEKAQNAYVEKFDEYERLVKKRNEDEKQLMEQMAAKQQTYFTELRKKQEEYEKERKRIIADYQLQEQNDLASNFNTLSAQVRATRLFRVSQFGIFNSDCPHAWSSKASVIPIFVANSTGFINPDYIYLVDHNNKTVYNLSQKDGFKIDYDPANAYSICVFSNNKLFICNKSAFGSTVGNGSNKFAIEPLPENADNIVDFKKSLEI